MHQLYETRIGSSEEPLKGERLATLMQMASSSPEGAEAAAKAMQERATHIVKHAQEDIPTSEA